MLILLSFKLNTLLANLSALSPNSELMTQLTLTSLVAINLKLISDLERVSKNYAAMPGLPIIPAPLLLNLVILFLWRYNSKYVLC